LLKHIAPLNMTSCNQW